MNNSFGKIFRLTTFGESHGKAIGGIIDGFPSNIEIDFDFIQNELNKRKPGTNNITSQRKEVDKVIFLSGIYQNLSLGSPIGFFIENQNIKSEDYISLKDVYRPGHADFTYQYKYGIRDYRGGGRSSARETANWVVGGAFAKIVLQKYNISINAYTSQIGNIKSLINYNNIDFSKTYDFETRCPDDTYNKLFKQHIQEVSKKNDSVGGIICCVIKNLPIGLGEPIFEKFHANLGKAILSINACKGFEIGNGFFASENLGSENNDEMSFKSNKISFNSNNAGGVLGGITNGQDVFFRAAFKPTPSISKTQKTISSNNENIEININGRHDPCVVPRAVIIVEAMTAMVVADFLLLKNVYKFNKKN